MDGRPGPPIGSVRDQADGGATPRTGAPGHAHRDGSQPERRGFIRFTTAGAVAVAAVAILPATLAGPWYLLVGWTTLIVAAVRVRRLPENVRRAGTFMLLAGGMSLTGAMVRGAEAALTGVDYPFPSIADAFSIASYPLFLAAIAVIISGRIGRPGTDLVIDALVASLAVAVLQWELVLLPFLADAQASGAALAINVLYSVLSTLLVAAATMITLAGGHRSTSNRLLAAGLAAVVLLDLTATLVTADRIPTQARLIPAAAVFVLGAAGLMHPSVLGLMQRASGRAHLRRLTQTRIAVLGLALLVPPSLLTLSLIGHSPGTMWLPVAGSLLLAPLVVVRLGRLVRTNQTTAETEAILRSVSEELVGADSDLRIEEILVAGVARLVGQGEHAPRFVLVDPPEQGRAAGAAAAHGHPATAPLVRAAVNERRSSGGTVGTGELVELGVPGWVAAVVLVEGQLRGAILAESTRLNAEQLQALQSLCRDASFALRAVDRTEITVRQRSEERFGALVDNSSDIVVVLDDRRRPVYVSPVAGRLLGYPLDYLEQLDVLELVHPEDRGAATELADAVLLGRRLSRELRLRHVAGTYHWFEVIGTDLSDDPNVAGVVLTAREIGDRKSAEERLLLSEARFKALVQHSSDLVVAVVPGDGLRYASPSVAAVTGRDVSGIHDWTLDQVFPNTGLRWDDVVPHVARSADRLLHFTFDDASGRRRHIEATVTDLRAEPSLAAYVLNGRDVSERTAMMERLQHQATHDALTGLANRVRAGTELGAMLARNDGASSVAVISIDLDDFKNINDSLGHAAGDVVLRAVADRVARVAGEADLAVRSGGDEFLLVLERGHGEAQVTEVAQDLLESLAQPLLVDGRSITVSASAGVAFDHDRSWSAEDLLRNADTAMYRAKNAARQLGRPQITVFESVMHSDSYDRFELRGDLARAIAGEQLEAYYQPVVDLCTQRIVGLEALVRWNHPHRGLLGPNVFVPLAEESGLILELGRWMRQRACRDLAAWRAADPAVAGHLTVAVNLSAAEMHDEDLVRSVVDLLAHHDLPAGCLTLEITESSLLTDTDLVQQRMDSLRERGIRFAIDDFGTGYSSLGYIHRFAFDVLKVDRSFVDGLDQPTNQRIVAAVLDLANQMGATVVAEGIEELHQETALTDLGVELGQGYLYSRPVPAEAFRHLLQAQQIDLT
jgi:diguanylate cyclase (GGDEF)-like protein/PAS domain S-box-containing protein